MITCSVPPAFFCILIFVFFFSRFSTTLLWWCYNFIICPTFLLVSLCSCLNKWIYIYIFEYGSGRSLSRTFNDMLWKKHVWITLFVRCIDTGSRICRCYPGEGWYFSHVWCSDATQLCLYGIHIWAVAIRYAERFRCVMPLFDIPCFLVNPRDSSKLFPLEMVWNIPP